MTPGAYLRLRREAAGLATKHPTWCDVHMTVRYGRAAPDDRQIDIEDSIAPSLGGEPEAAPLPDPDASTAGAVDVSAHPSNPRAAQSRNQPARVGARGRKPEPAHV